MMKWKTFVIGYALALALLLFAQHRPEQSRQSSTFAHIVDLTHSISASSTPRSPASQTLLPRPISAVVRYGSRGKAATKFATRLEAPAHYAPALWSVAQIPPERLFAPLAVIDVRAQVRRNQDYQLTVTDIAEWERIHGQIPQGAVVMARTGWDTRWASPGSYRNNDGGGVPHFPGFSLQAARFLVEGRNVVGLGIDTASISSGDTSNSFSTVRNYTLSHSVYQIANVANLGQAPPSGGLVLVAPAKLQDSSQAPARVLALAR
ncbi:MAG TPA: cyclase family protein [Terriglobales bacterium]|jgi:kynurenine formamidase|nr:cyclase family protein [Terriglobales bacterium]